MIAVTERKHVILGAGSWAILVAIFYSGTPNAQEARPGGCPEGPPCPVLCKDGSTSRAGVSACRNHGGIDKSSTSAAAPGGGPGLVWVNTASKVYHCSSDPRYGKTKQGQYMSEGDAKARGIRPDHNKPCS